MLSVVNWIKRALFTIITTRKVNSICGLIMTKPAIHVFVGVGPANLHRALALRKVDPEAKFIFVDKRLNLKGNEPRLNRYRARANIFRFETDEVTKLLIQEGVDPYDMSPLIFEREFDPVTSQGRTAKKPVFQMGDEQVFSAKPFTQIQIRDLQLLLLQSIEKNSGENSLLFLPEDLPEPFTDHARFILALVENEERFSSWFKGNKNEKQNIHIHVATGALSGDEEKDEIIYSDQTQASGPTHDQHTTADVSRMTVTPTHGTVTFKIDPSFLETLRDNQVSLDDTEWQKNLKSFGWNLIRPPRIRVFYTNDILYIGAEVPHSMYSLEQKHVYEQEVTAYTRRIAKLVFPNLHAKIQELPVNTRLRSRFPTQRGQRGEVLKMEPRTSERGKLTRQNITTYYHGDSRYLPHYQTGSGFITAFLENELYVAIYQYKSIDSLLTWLYEQADTPGIEDQYTKEQVIHQYSQDIPLGATEELKEQYALEAFKAELFKQRSLDIIEKNQEKVGRYLNALNTQTLAILSGNYQDLINSYNAHTKSAFPKIVLNKLDSKFVVIALLKLGNIVFLREQMPQLLNIDFDSVDDKQLIHLRNMLVKDLQFSLMVEISIEKDNVDQPELCSNYEDFSNTSKEENMVQIDYEINQVMQEMIKGVLVDYIQGGGFWRSFKSFFPWTRTHANIEKASKIIQKIDENGYDSFSDLKQEIFNLDAEKAIGKGALKKAVHGVTENLEASEESNFRP